MNKLLLSIHTIKCSKEIKKSQQRVSLSNYGVYTEIRSKDFRKTIREGKKKQIFSQLLSVKIQFKI